MGEIDTSGLAAGRHMVFVQGVNSDGKPGAVSAAFLDVSASPTAPGNGGGNGGGTTEPPKSGGGGALGYLAGLLGLAWGARALWTRRQRGL